MRMLYQHDVAAMEVMDLCGVLTVDAEVARCADAQYQDVAVAHHGAFAFVFAQPDLTPCQRCSGNRIARGHCRHRLW